MTPRRESPLSWRDEDGRKLEQQLTDIIIGMAVAGEHLHRKWLEQQAAWARQRQEEAEREARRRKTEDERRERERLAALEKAKRDALRRDAKAWREANDIRTYVEAIRRSEASPEATEDWAHWALLEADRIDPIVSGRALETMREALDDDDKSSDGGTMTIPSASRRAAGNGGAAVPATTQSITSSKSPNGTGV